MSGTLQIDAGNSAAKWRRVRDGRVVAAGRSVLGQEQDMAALAAQARAADEVWLASVLARDDEAAMLDCLRQSADTPLCQVHTQAHCAGVTNSYEDPASMGVDRWLALLAARRRLPGRLCVIDAGTALTIDLLDAAGVHEGGYIVPGRALMQRALFAGTGRVRAQDPGWPSVPGRSTATAVSGGAGLALAGAVLEALRRAGEPAPALIVTGGDGAALIEAASLEATLVADLVFEGLELAMLERA